MARKSGPDLAKYAKLFDKHMSKVDELTLAVLKGHLIIEGALDDILATIFFYPGHVDAARLGFVRKVHIARAYALRKNELPVWDMILTINALRNELAHKLEGEKRKKMDDLRKLYDEQCPPGSDKAEKARSKMEDHTIVYLTCIRCTGFLGTYEYDLKGLRKIIDSLDFALEPRG
jgi:hypothetical protein